MPGALNVYENEISMIDSSQTASQLAGISPLKQTKKQTKKNTSQQLSQQMNE